MEHKAKKPTGVPKKFTEKMQEELLGLKALLEGQEELASFPWERYHALAEWELLSKLPKRHPAVATEAKTRLRGLLAKEQKVLTAISSALTMPDTDANAIGHSALLYSLSQERLTLKSMFSMHETFVEANILAPGVNVNQELTHVKLNMEIPRDLRIKVSSPTAPLKDNSNHSVKKFSVRTKQVVAPTFESLCSGKDDNQRRENATKIDKMWAAVKSKTREENYPVACAAVYKLAEWLGIAEKGIKAREWQAVLQKRYDVLITEALSKYTIEKGNTKPFREFALAGFAFAEANMALKAKNHPLPAVYRQIPTDTKTRKSGG